jgi:hypothetical protein
LYNHSNSNGLISPTSNGLATSATYSTEFSFFPDINSNGSGQSQGQGQGSGQMYNASGHMINQNPGQNNGPSLLDLGMDKDMFMALGIEGGAMGMNVDPNAAGGSGQGQNGNGGGSGSGGWEGGNEQGQSGDWSELDFDQWVDGMGGAY